MLPMKDPLQINRYTESKIKEMEKSYVTEINIKKKDKLG